MGEGAKAISGYSSYKSAMNGDSFWAQANNPPKYLQSQPPNKLTEYGDLRIGHSLMPSSINAARQARALKA